MLRSFSLSITDKCKDTELIPAQMDKTYSYNIGSPEEMIIIPTWTGQKAIPSYCGKVNYVLLD